MSFKVRGHGSGAIVVGIKCLQDLVDVLWASLVVGVFKMGEDKVDTSSQSTFIVSVIAEEGLGDGFGEFKIDGLFNIGLPKE